MSFSQMIVQMSRGLGSTFGIFALTLLFSLPLGMLIAFLRMSKFAPLSWFAKIYISILRGTPLMLQLLMVNFAPFYLFGLRWTASKLVPILIAFSLNYAAYFAEIYRGGIESMPAGQYEAAAVLGYSRSQTFLRIILPQVVKRILPSITNEVITLIKDTSMAYVLSYAEMYYIGKQIASSYASFTPFVIAGVFYYVFNIAVAFVMGRIEKSMNYYR